MKNTKVLTSLVLLLITNTAFLSAQNVGVGTSSPVEKLHVAGSLRVDDLQTSLAASAATDKMVWVDANGKVYSFPAGTPGKILGVNGTGILAWLDQGMSSTLNNGQIWIGDAANTAQPQTLSGDAVVSNTGVVTIQDNAVDGTDITISGESGGSLMYFNGTDWVNLGIGTPGQILTISGGVPAWVSPPAAPTLGNLTSSTAGVTVTGGTGAVIGAGTTVNVATNALNQNGLVTGPTAANANQVWGTDPLGNPGWIMPVSNDWRLLGNTATNDPAVPVTYGTTAIGAGENYLGTGDAQDLVLATNATERFRVKQTTGFVGIGTATPATRLHGFRNDNANKAAILGQASQIGSGVTDFQNIGVQGYGQGLSAWGYGIGVAGLTDPATAWVGVGVYARFGSIIPAYTWIGTDLPDAALYADGDNSAPAAVFANGRVGVMNTLVNPVVNAMLDVNGDLALREGAAMNVAAGINNLAAPANEFSHYRLTGAAGAFSIASLGGGSNGQIVNLINTTNQTMTIVNGAAIRTGSGSNLVLGPQGSVSMIYNSTLAAWQVTSKSGEPDMNLAAYSQTTTLFGCATTLKTITITTAATDRVLLLGEADYLKTGSTAYFALGIYRNGVEIHEVAAYSPVNADNSLHTNWIDTPGAGTHTYTIRYTLGAGTASFYGSNLMGYIIK